MAMTMKLGKAELMETARQAMLTEVATVQWTDRQKIALTCRALFDAGHDSGLAGQISARGSEPGTFLTQRLGLGFDEITEGNLLLVDEDLERSSLPEPVVPYLDRCFGLTTTVERLTRVRNERRPGSRYASPEQCRWELRRADDLFAAHRLPMIDTSSKSVEEISTHILQTLAPARAGRRGRPHLRKDRP